MRRSIVFLGNYQAHTLHLAWLGCIPISGSYNSRLVDYLKVSDADRVAIETADVIVAQVSDQDYYGLEATSLKASIVRFPYVNGSFLWPHAGHTHPEWTSTLMHQCPGVFAGETGDGFLTRLHRLGTPTADAVEQYAALDIVKTAKIDRRYELSLDMQRMRDSKSALDVNMADYIERNISREILFYSRQRLAKPIFWHLARNIFSRVLRALGENDKMAEEAEHYHHTYQGRPLEAPIHPKLVQHFDIPNRPVDYMYRVNRTRLTFDQNSADFMNAVFQWDIYAGIALLDRGEFERAADLLRLGLTLAPDSPDGASALSRALTQLGRHEEALEMACVAVHRDGEDRDYLLALADCYRQRNMTLAARAAVARALEIHPCHLLANQMLSDILVAMDQRDEAIALMRRLASRIPSSPFAHFRVGDLLRAAGDRRGAALAVRAATLAGERDNTGLHLLTDVPMHRVCGPRVDLRFIAEPEGTTKTAPDSESEPRTAEDGAILLQRPAPAAGDFVLIMDIEPDGSQPRCMSIVVAGEVLSRRSITGRTKVYCLLPQSVTGSDGSFDLSLLLSNGRDPADRNAANVILNRICVAAVQRAVWDGYSSVAEMLADLNASVSPSVIHDLAWDERERPCLVLPEGAEPHTVYTGSGTILYADHETGRVRHGKIGQVPRNLFLIHHADTAILARSDGSGGYLAVRFRPEGQFATGDDWDPWIGGGWARTLTMTTETAGNLPAFGLRGAGLFGCVEPGGEFSLSRVRVGPWETFFFQPVET